MRSDRQTSLKSIVTWIGVVVSFASGSTISAKTSSLIIANSSALDPAARQITRTVANETLRSITTKERDSNFGQGLVVERLEDDGPIVLPPKIVSVPAPGTRETDDREPAAETKLPDETPAESHEPLQQDEASAAESTPTETLAAPAKSVPPPHVASAVAISADKALLWLQNGNKRYLKKSNRADGKSQADRDRLAKSQHPHTIVLSCSDSRVPPETVFDQSLGEIFVVRTAGESLDMAVIASVEYAVEHLGPRLLIVMGHTSCGAVTAAINAKDGETAGSAALDALVADIKPRLPNRGPAGLSSQAVEIESAANAQGVAADLISRSKIIRDRVEKGDLIIKPALYYIDSGSVKFY